MLHWDACLLYILEKDHKLNKLNKVKKHHNNKWNLFQVNNKETRTTLMMSFWYLCCYLWTDFTHCSAVSIVDFEERNVG